VIAMAGQTSGDAGWAKAPDYADDPDRARAVREATSADRREFLTSGLRPIECLTCGTCVLVRKTSLRQTSIQWTTDASSSCAEFAARLAAIESRAGDRVSALLDTCEKLKASIELAVLDGLLEVPDG
jgi:hypothetical protein